MEQKKKGRGKEYLEDFRKDLNGNYQYTGTYCTYCGKLPRKMALALLWLLCGGSAALLLAAGFVPAPGAMDRFYVLLPYAIALVAQVSAIWALVRLTAGGEPLRKYVHEQTIGQMPMRCLLSALFAAVAAMGECADLSLRGAQNAPGAAATFIGLVVAACLADNLAAILLRRMTYSENSGEKN